MASIDRRRVLAAGGAMGLAVPLTTPAFATDTAKAEAGKAETAKAAPAAAPTATGQAEGQTAAVHRTLTLVSDFPASRDAIGAPMTAFAATVSALTGGALKIAIRHAGDADTPADPLAAVAKGTVDIAHLSLAARADVEPSFAIAAGLPFGLNARMQAAWLADLGGNDALAPVFARHGLVGLPAGNTGAAMGGWFREAITDPAGLKGLKLAIGGLAATIFKALGAEPVDVPHAKLAEALKAGTVDAAVWGSPYDDEALRLYQSARVLAYPGWWQGAGQLHLVVTRATWDALSDGHRTALMTAAAAADRQILARYDAQNPAALRRAVASGAQLHPFSEAMLDACFKASEAVISDIAARDATFKALLAQVNEVRRNNYLWAQLAENTYDTYLMIQQQKKSI